jgi:hypothetical protein
MPLLSVEIEKSDLYHHTIFQPQKLADKQNLFNEPLSFPLRSEAGNFSMDDVKKSSHRAAMRLHVSPLQCDAERLKPLAFEAGDKISILTEAKNPANRWVLRA